MSQVEHEHQKALFQWANNMGRVHPELSLMFAVPNAGKRSIRLGVYMKAEGLRAGVPDIVLPVARKGFHALFIEMKAPKTGKMQPEQIEWQGRLNMAGNLAITCFGWEAARDRIKEYLQGEK